MIDILIDRYTSNSDSRVYFTMNYLSYFLVYELCKVKDHTNLDAQFLVQRKSYFN